MNAQNINQKPVVKRETKNKIRVDFDRTPLKDRLKAKFLSFHFIAKVVLWIFRMVLMIGISYIVLFPFLTKISGSFMAPEDFVDVTVRLIPKHFTLDIYRGIISELGYWEAFMNTFTLSFCCAIIQTFICCLIGYGFAKFKFKGRNLLFLLVMLTMIVPHQTLQLSMFMEFRYFDIFGIVRLLKGGGIELFGHNIKDLGEGVAAVFEKINILPDEIKWGQYFTERGVEKWKVQMEVTEAGINLCNTYFPLVLLSLGGLAFKNGLYIFLLRQFFRGIPDELEESAYMDGSGTFRTFIQIILPLSVPMMITVFLFAFCWQWTDDFYTGLFFSSTNVNLLTKIVDIPPSLKLEYAGTDLYNSAIRNTCGLMIIAPLVILYAFCQRFLVQGIEHSGIAN
ncbi:MAG: carbohydrate ABC transporter permease [Clostridia bacterium]|nr:carbohydrate ABC transporter permease [Clostridia bacterium]